MAKARVLFLCTVYTAEQIAAVPVDAANLSLGCGNPTAMSALKPGETVLDLGQAEAMPVEDGTVDVILSNCVINLAEDKGKVFEEAYRVLKPGGRVSISDMVTAGPLPMSLRSDPTMWAGCINGALPEQEYLDLMRQAGFVAVTGTRSLSGGKLARVEVYSLALAARKA